MRTILLRTLVIRINLALGVNLSIIQQNCLEITGYRIKYSTVLRPLELYIRNGRKVYTQVHCVNSNSRSSNCQCSLYSKKNPVIRIFCLSGWLAIQVVQDKWISTVMQSCPIVTPEILLPRLQKLIIITHYELPNIPLSIIISYPIVYTWTQNSVPPLKSCDKNCIRISHFRMRGSSSTISLHFTVAIHSALSFVVTLNTAFITGYPRIRAFCALKLACYGTLHK
jgi:hypothetical protein